MQGTPPMAPKKRKDLEPKLEVLLYRRGAGLAARRRFPASFHGNTTGGKRPGEGSVDSVRGDAVS